MVVERLEFGMFGGYLEEVINILGGFLITLSRAGGLLSMPAMLHMLMT